MPYKDFNETKYVYVAESSPSVTKLGCITAENPVEIEHIRLDLYKHGTEVGDEVFRLNIYSDPDYSNLLSSSSDVALASIPDLGEFWIGWVRFDFADIPIIGGTINHFYIGLESVTYTRVGDTFYVGAAADDPPREINTVGVGVGGYLEVYGRATSDVCG